MRRLACTIVVLGMVMPWNVASAGPRGRVVRIERPRAAAAIPRMCMTIFDDRMICLGKPAVDERVELFDAERGKPVGVLEVDSAADFNGFRACPGQPSIVFEVKGTIISGDPSLLDGSRHIVGVRGAQVDSTSRLLKRQASPSGLTDRQVEMAIDYDADGTTDFVIEHYTCGDRAGARSATTCFDTWVERHGKLTLVDSMRLQVCP